MIHRLFVAGILINRSESAVKQCYTGTHISTATKSLNDNYNQKLPTVANCTLGSMDACMVSTQLRCHFYILLLPLFYLFQNSDWIQKAYGMINQSLSIASYMCTSEMYCDINIKQNGYTAVSICCFTDNCNHQATTHTQSNTKLVLFILIAIVFKSPSLLHLLYS